MEGLRIPNPMRGLHVPNHRFPLPSAALTSGKCGLLLATGSGRSSSGGTQNAIVQVSPIMLKYKHYNAKTSRRLLFAVRYTSASIQSETKESVGTTSVDVPMSGNAIRQRFLEFYASRGHKVLLSASLVPDDPTVLLTIAGMLQFKPVFLGKVWVAA